MWAMWSFKISGFLNFVFNQLRVVNLLVYMVDKQNNANDNIINHARIMIIILKILKICKFENFDHLNLKSWEFEYLKIINNKLAVENINVWFISQKCDIFMYSR